MFLEELLLHKFFWYYLNVAFIFSKLNLTIVHQMRTKGLPSSYLDVFFFNQTISTNLPIIGLSFTGLMSHSFLVTEKKLPILQFPSSSLCLTFSSFSVVMCEKQSSGFRTHLYYCVLFTEPNRYIFRNTDINLFNWQFYKFVQISRLH